MHSNVTSKCKLASLQLDHPVCNVMIKLMKQQGACGSAVIGRQNYHD